MLADEEQVHHTSTTYKHTFIVKEYLNVLLLTYISVEMYVKKWGFITSWYFMINFILFHFW